MVLFPRYEGCRIITKKDLELTPRQPGLFDY